MKKLAKALIGITSTASMFVGVGVIHAADAVQTLKPATKDINENGGTIQEIISKLGGSIIDIVLLIAGILAVLYLIWNGIQYITSAGNPEKVKVARAGIINAVIGIIVIVAAYIIIRFAVGIGKSLDTPTKSTQAPSITRFV